MVRKPANDSKKRRKKRPVVAPRDGTDHSAQESEYLNLRKRVEARSDAKQILDIAKRIQDEPDH
jgi:hypothetical protein